MNVEKLEKFMETTMDITDANWDVVLTFAALKDKVYELLKERESQRKYVPGDVVTYYDKLEDDSGAVGYILNIGSYLMVRDVKTHLFVCNTNDPKYRIKYLGYSVSDAVLEY